MWTILTRIIICFAMLIGCNSSPAQIKPVNLQKKDIPSKISYKGTIVNAVKWSDKTGTHLVITSESGEVPVKGQDDYREAALYAQHYLISKDVHRLTWTVQDFVKECPVDISANFVKNSFAITDLNKNNKAEVWLMYKVVCRGDVSPSDMKVIMYEDGKKYAMRGTNRVKVSEKGSMGGEYTFDKSFASAPKVFTQYAKQLWNKHIDETWE